MFTLSETVRPTLKNQVLSNTYRLLAMSLIPTILGVVIGLQLNLNRLMMTHSLLSSIAFLIASVWFFFKIEKNKTSGKGVINS